MNSRSRTPGIHLEGIRLLVRRDLRASAEVLARAMADDPLMRFFVPYVDIRPRALPRMFYTIARYGQSIGRACATPNLEGVMIWRAPCDRQFTDGMAARFGGLAVLRALGMKAVEVIRRMSRYEEAARRIHGEIVSGPHAYLVLIGVDPAYHGKGFASALVKPLLSYCDLRSLPCYLETHNPKNVSLYEHFGFKIEKTVDVEPRGPRQWCMLRPEGGAT
jgi:GNAT superfamily N-acetyltransferase